MTLNNRNQVMLYSKFKAKWLSLKHRKVFIWGAGQQGRGMLRILDRQGIQLEGIIDSNTSLQGTRVSHHTIHTPKILRAYLKKKKSPFVIISSMLFDDVIADHCRQLGLEADKDYISYKYLKPYDYVVDVSGTCNLTCMACPRSHQRHRHPPKGFMKAVVFEKVVEKILKEDPFVGSIQLYQWGEPLLNPELPDILDIANGKGIPCAISSNLNVPVDLKPIIQSGPEWFRVSISGTGEEYERTHRGARWEKLLSNLELLSHLKKTLKPDMKTEILYHLYRHNSDRQFHEMKTLCQRLGFELHPVWAYLISLDDMMAYLDSGQLSAKAKEASNMLMLSLEDGMALAKAESHKACLVDRCVPINWDLSVSHCMMYFYPEENVAVDNFLEHSLEEIMKMRSASRLCRRCRQHSLHRYCSVYSTKPFGGEEIRQ